jgi:DNA-directed RNA polymerase subunit K/omega
MSDDGDDYGEYEEFEPADDAGLGDDDGPPSPAADADADDDELGLDEDAAGTDEDEADEPDEPHDRARPEKARVDPITRMSNKPRTVVVVPDDERVTDNRLHKSEAAYIISMRSQQIARHATCFVPGEGLHDPVSLAFKELLARRCPLKLRRTVGTGANGELIVEEWIVREMTLPALTPPVPLGTAAAARPYAPDAPGAQ